MLTCFRRLKPVGMVMNKHNKQENRMVEGRVVDWNEISWKKVHKIVFELQTNFLLQEPPNGALLWSWRIFLTNMMLINLWVGSSGNLSTANACVQAGTMRKLKIS